MKPANSCWKVGPTWNHYYLPYFRHGLVDILQRERSQPQEQQTKERWSRNSRLAIQRCQSRQALHCQTLLVLMLYFQMQASQLLQKVCSRTDWDLMAGYYRCGTAGQEKAIDYGVLVQLSRRLQIPGPGKVQLTWNRMD